jgi:3-hydroxybutyryl-CoA dehydratase
MDIANTMQWSDIERIKVGDTAMCDFVVDAQAVQTFADLSSDDNALHMDTAVAESCGFPKRVAHGMLALSAISRLIGTQLPGHGSLWSSEELRFVTPVFVGDSLTARVTVEQVSRGAEMVKLKTEVNNNTTGAVVISGTAMVKVPRRKNKEGQLS